MSGLDKDKFSRIIDKLSPKEKALLAYYWPQWARPEQLAPKNVPWSTWLVCAGRGWGKALALDTPIPTPTGWTTMGDIQLGDELFDEAGNVCRVTFATPVQHNRVCYDVVFSDGSVITADAEHRWLTWDKAARKAHGRAKNPTKHPEVRTTFEIAASLMNGKEVNHAVQTAEPLILPDTELPIDPYVFGVWLGDGSSACAEITGMDEEIFDQVEKAGYVFGKPRRAGGRAITVSFKNPNAGSSRGDNGRYLPVDGSPSTELRRLGVLKNKHIPVLYARASAPQRLALLQGLMDTDGACCPGGHVEFVSVSDRLAWDVFELVCSLGFKPTMKVDRARLNGVDCGPRYRISWTPHHPVFRLSRKLDRQHTGKSQAARNKRRFIIEVRPRDSVPVRCIQVDSPNSLFLVGRAMIPTHNTRVGAEWVRSVAKPGARIAIVAPTAADARDVCIQGESGLLSCCPPWDIPEYQPSLRRVVWKNGAIATTYSADEPERLRGPQHTHAWCDEVGAWRYPETWDMLAMGLRLGDNPRTVVTTTPRQTPLMKIIRQSSGVIITRGRTLDNVDNLAPTFMQTMMDRYGGTRLARQELDGEDLWDEPGALWDREVLDETRQTRTQMQYARVVVSVDPAGSNTADSDETGIIVAAKGMDGHGYVLADLSGKYSPDQWARKAIAAYEQFDADRIIAEKNQGGDMVAHTLKTVNPEIPLRLVHASRGKIARAEPVAALYEQRKIHHVGCFGPLEDQMCTWVQGMKSPDRLDALVWALTELFIGKGDFCFG